MDLRKIIILICFFCIILCGCEKDKIIIKVPADNSVANSYIDSAGESFDQKDYSSALNDYLKAEKIYLNMNHTNTIEIAGIYNMIGRCYMQLREYNEAKEYFEKSLPISERLSNEKLNFENYINLMEISYSMGKENQESALEYGRKAEKSAIILYGSQSSELSEVYSDIGNVYCANKEYDKAEKYLKKALKIVVDSFGENHEKSAVIYNDMANMYEKQEQYDKAEEYLKKAEEIFKNYNNEYWLAVVYGDLGNIYCDKEEYENALACFNRCLDIYKSLGDVDFDLAEYQYYMAGAHFGLKDYESCKQDLLLAYQICESIPVKSEHTETLITKIKENLEIYYDNYYEGDKSTGFEAWYEELISSQPVQ